MKEQLNILLNYNKYIYYNSTFILLFYHIIYFFIIFYIIFISIYIISNNIYVFLLLILIISIKNDIRFIYYSFYCCRFKDVINFIYYLSSLFLLLSLKKLFNLFFEFHYISIYILFDFLFPFYIK